MKPPRRLVGAVCLAALAFACTAAASTGAEARTESFDHGLQGWKGHRATVSVVRGGLDGKAVRVRLRPAVRKAAAFWIYRAPRPVARAERGAVYDGAAWVRHERGGGTLCIRIREVDGGRIVGSSQACERVNGRWQQLGVSHTARANGSELGVAVLELQPRRGSAFRADRISLVRRPDKVKPPSPPPAPPRAARSSRASGTASRTAPATGRATSDGRRRRSGRSSTARGRCGRTPTALATLDKLASAGVRWVRIDVALGRDRGPRQGRAQRLVHRDGRLLRRRGTEARDQGPRHALADAELGERRPRRARSRPRTRATTRDFAAWAAALLARPGRRLGGLERARSLRRRSGTGRLAQYVALLQGRLSRLQDRRPRRHRRPRRARPRTTTPGPAQVYSLGAKGSFDVLATHPYQGIADAPPEHPDDGNRWWFTHPPAVSAVMVEYGDGDKPIWFTEMGWSAHANWSGRAELAARRHAGAAGGLLRPLDRVHRGNYPYVPVMFWYKERPHPAGTDVHLEGYGLLDANLGERPAYAALKRACPRLERLTRQPLGRPRRGEQRADHPPHREVDDGVRERVVDQRLAQDREERSRDPDHEDAVARLPPRERRRPARRVATRARRRSRTMRTAGSPASAAQFSQSCARGRPDRRALESARTLATGNDPGPWPVSGSSLI